MRTLLAIALLGLGSHSDGVYAEFDGSAVSGQTAMQQLRQVQANTQGYGNVAGEAVGYSQGSGVADGDMEFSITFKGRGRSDVENAMSQSRQFSGNVYQSRALNNTFTGANTMYNYLSAVPFYAYYYSYPNMYYPVVPVQ